MAKKKYSKKYNIPINIYEDGAFLANSKEAWGNAFTGKNLAGTIGSVGSAASSIVGAGVSNAQIADTSGLESNIDAAKSYIVGASDNDALMSEWCAWSPMENVHWKDIRGGSTGQRLTNTIGAVGQGAMAGATVGGPIGAIVGGAAGLIGGVAGWISGGSKAKKKARALNEQIDYANEKNLLSLETRADAIDAQNDLIAMANFAAKGGKIHIKPENRGKFTEYCGGKVTSECIAKGKRSSDPAVRKRATFAANARKWKHEFGGNLFDDGGLMNQHGGLFSNDVVIIGNGGTHEQNPFDGVQMGVDAQGIPNMVEEGEVIWNDYVFSNRLKPTQEFKDKYKVKGETFADVAKKIQEESAERPNDPISKRGLEDSMMKLQIEQETMRMKEKKNTNSNMFDGGGDLSWLRYAPVVGSGIGVISDLFSKPDYSNANLVMEAANKAGQYTSVQYTPIGNYLSYNPLDINYYSNKLGAQAGATRRAIVNQSAGNRATAVAGLLASDYNTQGKYGDLMRQAEEFNLAQKQAVEQFNRATNQANAEMGLQAARANQAARQAANEARLKGVTQAAALRDAEDKQRAAGRSANLTSLFDNIGNIGVDELNRADRDMLIKSGVFGTLSQKPTDWSDAKWQAYQDALALKACGGKINRKRSRKGLTY